MWRIRRSFRRRVGLNKVRKYKFRRRNPEIIHLC